MLASGEQQGLCYSGAPPAPTRFLRSNCLLLLLPLLQQQLHCLMLLCPSAPVTTCPRSSSCMQLLSKNCILLYLQNTTTSQIQPCLLPLFAPERFLVWEGPLTT